jgi:hypothetical protein
MGPANRDLGDAARADEPGRDVLQFGVRPGARLVSQILIIVSAASLILMDVALIVGTRGNPAVRIIDFIVVNIVGVPFVVWLKRRLLDATVRADPSGLYIFNGLGTHVVAWREVEGFGPSSRPFLLAVKRTCGRPIPMAGITPETFGRREAQREDMRELEEYWRRTVARVARVDADLD